MTDDTKRIVETESLMSDVSEKFHARHTTGDGCWEWTGTRGVRDYGRFWVNGRAHQAHRISWELHNGAIPTGMVVMHTCDNPPCVNPAHLTIGTQHDNVVDCISKGRFRTSRVTGEAHGQAKVSEADVVEMRRLRREGLLYRTIADRFNVDKSTVRRACIGKTWPDLRGGEASNPKELLDEALRMLEAAGPVDGGTCHWCGATDVDRGGNAHTPDCPWLALMKKAGLR